MKKIMKVAAAGILLVIGVALPWQDASAANDEITSLASWASYEEAQAHFAPYRESRRKEMKAFFEENQENFAYLYEYLMSGAFSSFMVSFNARQYSLSVEGEAGECSFDFLHMPPELTQTFDLLAADGVSGLAFDRDGDELASENRHIHRNSIVISYPYVTGEDKVLGFDFQMEYTRNIDIEMGWYTKVEELADNWNIVYVLMGRGE